METTNPTRGFHGAFSNHDTDPTVAWPLASEAIAKATGCPAKCVKVFLESSKGGLFAEGVIKLMSANISLQTAIDAMVKRWMDLKISPEDASVYGIPARVPYLKGFACHCELEADTG